jgi:glutamate 5-kinase
MATKLAAAKKAGRSGAATLIVNGRVPGMLTRAVEGAEVGTLFLPARKSLTSRKHWIAFTIRPKGRLIVDEGARAVLSQHGRSLLPSGIVRVEGEFERGACVRVCGPDGSEFARGISDYSHAEVERLVGMQSSEIESLLGYKYGDEIIHRDNLVVL